jgi:PAS domain S-box-containing protein
VRPSPKTATTYRHILIPLIIGIQIFSVVSILMTVYTVTQYARHIEENQFVLLGSRVSDELSMLTTKKTFDSHPNADVISLEHDNLTAVEKLISVTTKIYPQAIIFAQRGANAKAYYRGFTKQQVDQIQGVLFDDVTEQARAHARERNLVYEQEDFNGRKVVLFVPRIPTLNVADYVVNQQWPLIAATGFLSLIAAFFIYVFLRRRYIEVIHEQQRFESFAKTSSDWFWETDASLKTSYLSEHFVDVVGTNNKTVIGQPLVQFVQQSGLDEQNRTAQTLLSALSNREAFKSLRFCLSGPNGNKIWLSINGSPSFDETQAFIGYRGVGTNVTDQMSHQSELITAKLAAESANNIKSDFLATMSHEIRTPLNGVIGMTSVLMDSPLSQDQKEHVQIIQRSGNLLLNVINDVLDFSKLESGKIELDLAPFNPIQLMDTVTEVMWQQAHSKGLVIASTAAVCARRNYLGDGGRIRQVLLNLASNAIKFTHAGGICIDIKTTDTSSTESVLTISVVDSGIGIPIEAHERLFESFVQVDASTTRRYGGTGLGLAICKGLVDAMGGKLGVQSTLGGGSCFWFEIPVTKVDDATIRAGATRAYPPRPEQVEGVRVLLIDDTAVRVVATRKTLEQSGLEIVNVASVKEGFDVLCAAPDGQASFDVVILDMQQSISLQRFSLCRLLEYTHQIGAKLIVVSPLSRLEFVRRFPSVKPDHLIISPVLYWDRLYAVQSVLTEEVQSGIEARDDLAWKNNSQMKPPPLLILLVEDNAINAKVAMIMLQRLGHSVDTANNGREAVTAYSSRDYDVILMDMQMPVMDGLQATRKIRQLEYDEKRTPIIALTANALKDDVERCVAAGMDAHLGKPFDLEELQAVVRRCTRT